jgi:hypothetical protein
MKQCKALKYDKDDHSHFTFSASLLKLINTHVLGKCCGKDLQLYEQNKALVL